MQVHSKTGPGLTSIETVKFEWFNQVEKQNFSGKNLSLKWNVTTLIRLGGGVIFLQHFIYSNVSCNVM